MPRIPARARGAAAITCLLAPIAGPLILPIELTALGGVLAPAWASGVYRCGDETGVPLFSQFPCANAETIQSTVITSISVVSSPRLTRSEQATLERLQKQFERNRASAASEHQRARRRTSRARAERQAQCRHSKDALRHLREQKRGGYSLTTARRLDADEKRLKREIANYC